MKIADQLRSRTYAVVFILLIIVSLILATVVPQKSEMSEAEQFRLRSNFPELHGFVSIAGLDHVYTTWWFLGIIFLFSLNIALNLSDRIAVARRQFGEKRLLEVKNLERLAFNCRLSVSKSCDDIKKDLAVVFSKLGYRVTEYQEGLRADKWRAGFWNVSLFHGSLLIILIGILVSSLTKFSGTFEISEGQLFSGERQDFINTSYGALKLAPKLDFQVRLSKFSAEYWDSEHPKLYESILDVMRNGTHLFSRNVEMNNPLKYEGLSFYQTKYYGYSAMLSTKDKKTGSEISGYVNLPYKERYSGIQVQDFNIPQTGYRAKLRFDTAYPNIVALSVLDGDRLVWNGLLQKGGSIDLEGSYLTLGGIVKWTALIVTRDWGAPIVYAGFALLISSVFSIVFIMPRVFHVICGEKGVLIGAKTARDRGVFREEFEDIVERIKVEAL